MNSAKNELLPLRTMQTVSWVCLAIFCGLAAIFFSWFMAWSVFPAVLESIQVQTRRTEGNMPSQLSASILHQATSPSGAFQEISFSGNRLKRLDSNSPRPYFWKCSVTGVTQAGFRIPSNTIAGVAQPVEQRTEKSIPALLHHSPKHLPLSRLMHIPITNIDVAD